LGSKPLSVPRTPVSRPLSTAKSVIAPMYKSGCGCGGARYSNVR
jgi:hypothetical protein